MATYDSILWTSQKRRYTELFIYRRRVFHTTQVPRMAKEKKGEGFHSAAGLIRYFDAEEKTALKIDPRLVIGMCIATIVILSAVHIGIPL